MIFVPKDTREMAIPPSAYAGTNITVDDVDELVKVGLNVRFVLILVSVCVTLFPLWLQLTLPQILDEQVPV